VEKERETDAAYAHSAVCKRGLCDREGIVLPKPAKPAEALLERMAPCVYASGSVLCRFLSWSKPRHGTKARGQALAGQLRLF